MMTPKQLAAELEIDPKRLRSYLRQNHPRTNDAKNTTWAIEDKVADATREHFAKRAAANA